MSWNRFLALSYLSSVPVILAVPQAKVARSTTVAPAVSHPTSLTHTPFSGTPTPTGALHASSIDTGVPSLGISPTATTYPSDGQLHDPQPGPYIPAGGVGTSGETPVYNAKSDFDYESLNIPNLICSTMAWSAFRYWNSQLLGSQLRVVFLIEFMADQEVGHATMVTNILGAEAPRMCTYNYPYTTVHEFVDFCPKFTRFGESGVYGFQPHLNSREAAILLLQSITTEARQQMIFRQFEGLFPMPVWFEVGVPQSWAWTLLAPYISSCPENQTRLAWQNFPALYIKNQPNPARINGSAALNETVGEGVNSLNSTAVPSDASCVNSTALGTSCYPAITHNRTLPLSWPGREVFIHWDEPGRPAGPNNSYITSTSAGDPKSVVWATQLNVTYSPLEMTGDNCGSTIKPGIQTYAGDPAINGTMFVAITDSDPYLSPFNLSMINPHVVAGPALYQSG
ncbi:stress response protein Rds1 [Aspergillus bombycis]|uniref:Stress response protein Rds1 n=1 Tax=Aspergillus bombycis TaxID=109264 RepID=A0A1F7ZPW0_9EURO|nr:stress response protein Rds1 [Aspergillus bombycis]OGM41494.1 stress response protein Rds1 [Aspergillus bombycis]